jgi:IS5 family transposase
MQAANDKQQLQPMLNKIVALPEGARQSGALLADNGYFSASNRHDAAKIAPLIAMGRKAHHPLLSERFAGAPQPPKDLTPVEAMANG